MNSRISSSGRLVVAVMLTVLSTSAALAHVKNLSVRGSFAGHGIGVRQNFALLRVHRKQRANPFRRPDALADKREQLGMGLFEAPLGIERCRRPV